VPQLQPLRADHAPAVLAFEQVNRSFFAATISDRGDDFFAHFSERHEELLSLQETGTAAFYVLVDEDGSVLGRFNLVDFDDGTATLGYRVAQHAAGRGVATATVGELCRLAWARHGLRRLKAATTPANFASQKVLTNAGFVLVGPVDEADRANAVGGKAGVWYERDLVPDIP
jgi:[ribosomal protein S5]-alanine N-acetyltransferase